MSAQMKDGGTNDGGEAFAALATRKESGASRFLGFFAANKKWWLMPVLVVLLFLGGLFLLSSSVAAPFIYTLF